MDKLNALGKTFSDTVLPQFAKTSQFVRAQFGQNDEKTQFPPEVLEMEKRVDAMKVAFQKMITTISHQTAEGSDYSNNLRDSFTDIGRTVSEKVTLLAQATTATEAASAIKAIPSTKYQPKTTFHAIARTAFASYRLIMESEQGAQIRPSLTDLASALEKYAIASERIGESRLTQDASIQAGFITSWNSLLNTTISLAIESRKKLESLRSDLDATKLNMRNNPFRSRAEAATVDENGYTPNDRAKIETDEEEFYVQTEEALTVMKNVLNGSDHLQALGDLIRAQKKHHQTAYEILSELESAVEETKTRNESQWAVDSEDGSV